MIKRCDNFNESIMFGDLGRKGEKDINHDLTEALVVAYNSGKGYNAIAKQF